LWSTANALAEDAAAAEVTSPDLARALAAAQLRLIRREFVNRGEVRVALAGRARQIAPALEILRSRRCQSIDVS
jgi:hypothetical protein